MNIYEAQFIDLMKSVNKFLATVTKTIEKVIDINLEQTKRFKCVYKINDEIVSRVLTALDIDSAKEKFLSEFPMCEILCLREIDA